jgi:hypothetical protein
MCKPHPVQRLAPLGLGLGLGVALTPASPPVEEQDAALAPAP